MHEGDISAGFDETVIAEKSMVCSVRCGSESDLEQGRTCV